MGQPVEGGVGHHGIREQGNPVLRRPVARDHDGGFEMALRDDLIEVLGLCGAEGREAKVIDDEKIGAEVSLHTPLPGLVCQSLEQISKEFDGLGKEDIIAQAAGLVTDGLSDVTLTRACRTVEEHGLAFFDKDTGRKIPDQSAIELGVKGEVKPLQGLFFLKGGPGESEVEFFGLPSLDFILNEELEEFPIFKLGAFRLLEPDLQTLKHAAQTEDLKLVFELVVEVHGDTSSEPK